METLHPGRAGNNCVSCGTCKKMMVSIFTGMSLKQHVSPLQQREMFYQRLDALPGHGCDGLTHATMWGEQHRMHLVGSCILSSDTSAAGSRQTDFTVHQLSVFRIGAQHLSSTNAAD
jgi:hypothetical protein